jgi:hypothetical protein
MLLDLRPLGVSDRSNVYLPHRDETVLAIAPIGLDPELIVVSPGRSTGTANRR